VEILNLPWERRWQGRRLWECQEAAPRWRRGTPPSACHEARPLVPRSQMPRHQVPRTQVPRHQVPRDQVPLHQVPRHQAPPRQVPRTQVRRYQVPRTQVPILQVLRPLLLLLWDEGGQSNDFQWGEEQRKITFIWDRFYRGTIFHRLFNGCHWFQLGEKGGEEIET
jgi:hypothetical protein